MTKRDKARLLKNLRFNKKMYWSDFNSLLKGYQKSPNGYREEFIRLVIYRRMLQIASVENQIEWVEKMWDFKIRMGYMQLVAKHRNTVDHVDIGPEMGAHDAVLFSSNKSSGLLGFMERLSLGVDPVSESEGIIPFAIKSGRVLNYHPDNQKSFLDEVAEFSKYIKPILWDEEAKEFHKEKLGIEWIEEGYPTKPIFIGDKEWLAGFTRRMNALANRAILLGKEGGYEEEMNPEIAKMIDEADEIAIEAYKDRKEQREGWVVVPSDKRWLIVLGTKIKYHNTFEFATKVVGEWENKMGVVMTGIHSETFDFINSLSVFAWGMLSEDAVPFCLRCRTTVYKMEDYPECPECGTKSPVVYRQKPLNLISFPYKKD